MEGLKVTIGKYSFLIHQTIIIWFVILLAVSIFFIIAGRIIRKANPEEVPHGATFIIEVIANFGKSVVGSNLGEATWKYLPFFGTVMLCMVISNIIGLLGLQCPTSNISVNITLALMMFFLIHGTDIRLHGVKGKIKSLCDPLPFLLPMNIIGDVALPLSLSMRLFGNMLAGSLIVTLLYMMIKNLFPYSVVVFAATPFLHMYFDIFSGCMQTYIFFTLASYNLALVTE